MDSEYKLSKYTYVIYNKEYIAVYSYVNSKIAFCNTKENMDLFKIFIKSDDYYETDFTKALKNFGMIIDKTYDEDKFIDYLFKKRFYQSDTLHIIMIPSKLCNFNCKYCYEEKDNPIMSDEILTGSINFIKNMINYNNYKKIRIEWFGGEPTLFEDLILKFFDELKKTEYSGEELTVGSEKFYRSGGKI